jgi:hypothetical protein
MSQLDALQKFATSVIAAGQAMLDDIKQMQTAENNADKPIAAAKTVVVFTPPPVMKENAASSSVAAATVTAT